SQSHEYAYRISNSALSPSRAPAWPRAIRSLSETSIESLRVAHNASYAHYPGATHWTSTRWQEAVMNHPRLLRDVSLTWQTESEGVVSYCLVYAEVSPAGPVAYLGHMGVIPRYRRRGIAHTLIRAIISSLPCFDLIAATASVNESH